MKRSVHESTRVRKEPPPAGAKLVLLELSPLPAAVPIAPAPPDPPDIVARSWRGWLE